VRGIILTGDCNRLQIISPTARAARRGGGFDVGTKRGVIARGQIALLAMAPLATLAMLRFDRTRLNGAGAVIKNAGGED
jgi:hypothetical protein